MIFSPVCKGITEMPGFQNLQLHKSGQKPAAAGTAADGGVQVRELLAVYPAGCTVRIRPKTAAHSALDRIAQPLQVTQKKVRRAAAWGLLSPLVYHRKCGRARKLWGFRKKNSSLERVAKTMEKITDPTGIILCKMHKYIWGGIKTEWDFEIDENWTILVKKREQIGYKAVTKILFSVLEGKARTTVCCSKKQ